MLCFVLSCVALGGTPHVPIKNPITPTPTRPKRRLAPTPNRLPSASRLKCCALAQAAAEAMVMASLVPARAGSGGGGAGIPRTATALPPPRREKG